MSDNLIAKSMCVVDMTRRCQSKVHTNDPQNPPPISISAAGWSYRYVYAGLWNVNLPVTVTAAAAWLGFQRPLAIRGLPRDGGGDVVSGDARVVSEDAPDTDLISWSCIRREIHILVPLCHGASVPCPREKKDCKEGPSTLWAARRVAFEER